MSRTVPYEDETKDAQNGSTSESDQYLLLLGQIVQSYMDKMTNDIGAGFG